MQRKCSPARSLSLAVARGFLSSLRRLRATRADSTRTTVFNYYAMSRRDLDVDYHVEARNVRIFDISRLLRDDRCRDPIDVSRRSSPRKREVTVKRLDAPARNYYRALTDWYAERTDNRQTRTVDRRKAKVADAESRSGAASGRILSGGATFRVT